MKDFVNIALAAAFGVVGIAACANAPAAENKAAPALPVVTVVVTETAAEQAKPVVDSFGYGALKLGMSTQDALNTGMIGAGQPYTDHLPHCSLHTLTGTDLKVVVSARAGVAAIPFTTAMSSNGTGIGATLRQIQDAHPNLKGGSPPGQLRAEADSNSNAHFNYQLRDDKAAYAALVFNAQDCAE